MLESQSLLVLPWALPAGVPAGRGPEEAAGSERRVVLDPATEAPLGFVCRRPRTGPRWLRWLLRPGQVLELHEAEDDSLLGTMHLGPRVALPWLAGRAGQRGRWELRDADDHFVGGLESYREWEASGWVATVWAQDPLGRGLVVLERWRSGSAVPFKVMQPLAPPHLTELATLTATDQGVLVHFAPSLEGEPFAKMMVLAAVLAASC